MLRALLIALALAALAGCTGEFWECECEAFASDDDDSAAEGVPYVVTLCSDQGWPDRAAKAAVNSCLANADVQGEQVGCSCVCDDQQEMCVPE